MAGVRGMDAYRLKGSSDDQAPRHPWLSALPRLQAPDGDMRGGEIPGSWPDPVPILSRSWRVSRQPFEFGLVGPSRPPHTPHHQHHSTSDHETAFPLGGEAVHRGSEMGLIPAISDRGTRPCSRSPCAGRLRGRTPGSPSSNVTRRCRCARQTFPRVAQGRTLRTAMPAGVEMGISLIDMSVGSKTTTLLAS